MAKMKIGHDPRNKKTKLGQRLIKSVKEVLQFEPIRPIIQEVRAIDEVALTARILASIPEAPKVTQETIIVKEVSKLDKRARQHSKAISERLKASSHHIAILRERSEILEEELLQKEDKMLKVMELLMKKISHLENRKPEEKQIVTEKIIEIKTEHKVPMHIYIALGISLLFNILILFKK